MKHFIVYDDDDDDDDDDSFSAITAWCSHTSDCSKTIYIGKTEPQ